VSQIATKVFLFLLSTFQKSPKTSTFGTVFSDPCKNPGTDFSETFGHVLSCSAIPVFDAKGRLAVFVAIRVIKKMIKQTNDAAICRHFDQGMLVTVVAKQ